MLRPAAADDNVLKLNGEAPKVDFGGGALTLIHSPSEDKLTCSGTIQAEDVIIEGASMTVKEALRKYERMTREVEEMERLVGLMPPPASPLPDMPPSPSLPPSSPTCADPIS